MRNFFKLYSGHLKSSRKVLLIASIGLICALTIVSSTNYYFDSSKPIVVNDYFSNNNFGGEPDINFNLNSKINTYNKSMTDFANAINKTRSEFNLNFIQSAVIFPSIEGLSTNITQNINSNGFQQITNNSDAVQIYGLNSGFSNELNQILITNPHLSGSQLPKSTNGLPQVFILFVNYNSYTTGVTFNVTMAKTHSVLFTDFKGHNMTVQVTGYATVTIGGMVCQSDGQGGTICTSSPNAPQYPLIQQIFGNGFAGFVPIAFTSNLNYFATKVQNLEPSNITSGSVSHLNYNIAINFNYGKIDPYNIAATESTIQSFDTALMDKFSNTGDVTSSFYNFNAQGKFQLLAGAATGYLFELFFVSLPVLIATLFVINYSFGLIHKNVIRQIGIYKTRGATSWKIFSFQVIDNIIVIALSVLVALAAGVPLSYLVLRTNYLLSFQYPATTYLILNFQAVMTLLIYTGVALTLLVNLRRVKRLSQISIVETENPEEKNEPFWKRHYLDVICFGFGLVIYITFYELFRNPRFASILGPIVFIIFILILPAIIGLVIGLILLINRVIPVILNKIGTVLWARTGDLLAFSFKNVIRHRQASTRAVMLISILIAFMVFFYALPYSSVVNNETNLYFHYGAEGNALFNSNGYNATTLKVIQDNFSQYLDSFTPYVILSEVTNGGNYQLLLVNTSTYLKTAYLNFDLGLTKSINQDFKNLLITNATKYNSTTFKTLNVILDQNSLMNRKASINSEIFIPGGNQNLNYHIIDSYKHWPLLDTPLYMPYPSSVKAISDISYFTQILNETLTNNPWQSVQQQGVLFKFKPGVNQTLISGWIQGNTSLNSINLVSASQSQFLSGVQFRLELGQINNDVIMVLIITIIVLAMFAYLQLSERRREIFTERALGMKLFQVAVLFFIETIILSITSIVIGVIMGAFLMYLFGLLIFNPGQVYPPSPIIFPMNLIIITNALILICSILVSVIPAYYVTRQDISKSFIDT